MPIGIFLYEIVQDFGTQMIAEFYTTKERVTPEVLKVFIEKHMEKDFTDATYKKDALRYYSSIIKAENLEKNLYLGFILKEEEDLISLKSMFETIEKKIAANFSPDKRKMQILLKDVMGSVMGLMEKLQEPKIIQEKINEKTKGLLDKGKLQEARALIELGETVPQKLSAAVKQAESYMKQQLYKKAKKSYLDAATEAEKIDEGEMVAVLNKKAEQCEKIPSYFKEREGLSKEIKKVLEEIEKLNFSYYISVKGPIEKAIRISNNLQDNKSIEILSDLKTLCLNAIEKANELTHVNNEIKKLVKKL
ncbi:MAG: hypothetical protein ACTSR8_04600 [Promethearchaeota archaeon]